MTHPGESDTEYHCQVCGLLFEAENEEDRAHERSLWSLFSIGSVLGDISVLACRACTQMGSDWVFEGYKRRIASGLDLNYH